MVQKKRYIPWKILLLAKNIRKEPLIKAKTLTVRGQTQFVEVKSNIPEFQTNNHDISVILQSNENEIEVLNEVNPNTLTTPLNLIKKQSIKVRFPDNIKIYIACSNSISKFQTKFI